jgi:hypothetical protein
MGDQVHRKAVCVLDAECIEREATNICILLLTNSRQLLSLDDIFLKLDGRTDMNPAQAAFL